MEQVPNSFPHLFIGYSIIFSILMIYVAFISSRTTILEKKLKNLEKSNCDQEGGSCDCS